MEITVKMSEDIFTEIWHWLKQNKVDEIWFDATDDRYHKVSLIKKTDIKPWGITRVIDDMDLYRYNLWDYLEEAARQLNDCVEKSEEE